LPPGAVAWILPPGHSPVQFIADVDEPSQLDPIARVIPACQEQLDAGDTATVIAARRARFWELPSAVRQLAQAKARAVRKLEYVDLATRLDDLKVPPGNRLHELERDRAGQDSISVNDQWRICFRFVDGDAYDVEITDYH